MKIYQNIQRNSGVTHHEIRPTSMRIRFVNGAVYVYDYDVPGRHDAEEMKKLAVEGRGLSRYISRHVGERFASKEGDQGVGFARLDSTIFQWQSRSLRGA